MAGPAPARVATEEEIAAWTAQFEEFFRSAYNLARDAQQQEEHADAEGRPRPVYGENNRDDPRKRVAYTSLMRALAEYPHTRHVVVPYDELAAWRPAATRDDPSRTNRVAAPLLTRPGVVLAAAQNGIMEFVTPRTPSGGRSGSQMFELPEGVTTFLVTVRVVGLPSTSAFTIRDLRDSHLGRFIEVGGLVKRASQAMPRLREAAWKCMRCQCVQIQRYGKESDDDLRKPMECAEEQGGCGRDSEFELVDEQSIWETVQFLQIQEPPESMRGGTQPLSLDVMVYDDLVDAMRPGDRVSITGRIAPVAIFKRNKEQRHRELRFLVNGVRKQSESFEEIQTTPEEEAEFEAAARLVDNETDSLFDKHRIYTRLRASLAPTIVGYDTIKFAILLALVGGTPKQQGAESVRSDIHILLAGDPGVAKSRLIRAGCAASPRRAFTSGNQGTTAGLLAAVVRDEFTGGFALEAGAMVLADLGVVGLDEIEKMEKDQLRNLTTAMEQQKANIAKAGIIAELNCRTTILAAANPRDGKFDTELPMLEQIDLPPYILSRFLIFFMPDKPHQQRDQQLAASILNIHRNMNRRVPGDEPHYFRIEWVRKYIAHAKRNYRPVLTDGAIAKLVDYYTKIRGSNNGQTGITTRQLEDLERLAEAAAKLRLSHEVTVDDAKLAIEVFKEYVAGAAKDDQGNIQFLNINAGQLLSQQERERTLAELARELMRAHGGTFSMEELVASAAQHQVNRAHVERHVTEWRRRNRLAEPRVGEDRFALV